MVVVVAFVVIVWCSVMSCRIVSRPVVLCGVNVVVVAFAVVVVVVVVIVVVA